ncbi:MAG TPA: TetR family transcriptional regulator [Azospirillum sp.]
MATAGTRIRRNVSAAPARPGEDGASSRDVLLQTALDFFSTRGFNGTSIRDIANALGVSVSNIYHYFGSKEGLWLEIMEYSVKTLPQRLESALADITDPLARFEALVKAHLTVSTSYQRELRMIFIEQDRLTVGGDKINHDVQRLVLAIYIRELEALRAAGFIHAEHLKILAFNVLGVINWQLRWYRGDGPLGADDVHREIIDFILHGLRGSRPD